MADLLMSAFRDTSNTSRILAGVRFRDSGGLHTAAGFYARDASGLHSVLSTAPAASVSPTTASGNGYSKTTIKITTNTVTVTAPTGSTYAWTFADAGWSCTNPTSASTAFSHSAGPGIDFSTTATCTVTSNGKTSQVSVAVDVSNNYAV